MKKNYGPTVCDFIGFPGAVVILILAGASDWIANNWIIAPFYVKFFLFLISFIVGVITYNGSKGHLGFLLLVVPPLIVPLIASLLGFNIQENVWNYFAGWHVFGVVLGIVVSVSLAVLTNRILGKIVKEV